MEHSASGRQKKITYPNGMTLDYGYDQVGRLNTLDYLRSDATTLAAYSHLFDNVGNITQVTAPEGAHQYTYDSIYQLTGADHPVRADETFTYDPVGNRLTTADHSNWSHDNNNRLKSYGNVSLSYNPNGAKKFYRIILNKRQIGLQRIVGTNLQSPIGRVIKCKSDHRNTAGIRFLPKFS